MAKIFTFKRGAPALLAIFTFAAVAGGLGGCSYFLGSKAKTLNIEFKQNTEECLSHFKENVTLWARTGEPRMGPQIDCLVRGMDQFSEQTVGRSGEGWSRSELSGFFDVYFPSKSGASASEWVEEILKIKQSWFGGYPDRLTRGELNRVKEFLLRLRPHLDDLSPYTGALFFSADGLEAEAAIRASESLAKIGDVLASEMRNSDFRRPAYDVDSILNLLLKLGMLKNKEARLLAFAEAAKGILVGGSARFIVSSEWPTFFTSVTRAWGIAIRAKFIAMSNDQWLESEIDATESLANDALDLLMSMVAVHSLRSNGIPVERIYAVIDAMADEKSKEIYWGLRAPTVKDLVPKVLGKILHGNTKSDRDQRAKFLGSSQIHLLRRGLQDWFAGQREILHVFGERKLLPVAEVKASFQDGKTSGPRAEIAHLLTHGRVLVRDPRARLWIMPETKLPEISLRGMTLINALRSAVSLIFRGYTHDPRPQTLRFPSLTKAEIVEIYWDIRELGLDLNLIDVRSTAAGARTFLESSIFTSASTGRPRVSTHEIIEWFHVALGGSFIADDVYDSWLMDEECQAVPLQTDVFKKPKITAECFRDKFWSNFSSYVENLPGLVAWYEGAPEETKAEFREALESAGRAKGFDSTRPVDSSELRSMVPILHYTENVIMNHDLNGDGLLDTDEVWMAFPTFRGLLQEMGAGHADTEAMQKTIFSYLLTFGVPPSSSWLDLASVGVWTVGRFLWRESADRLKILKLIGAFTIANRQKKQMALLKHVKAQKDVLRTQLSSSDPDAVNRLSDFFGCGKIANPDFTAVVREAAENSDAFDPAAFVTQVKNALENQRRFDLVCEPF